MLFGGILGCFQDRDDSSGFSYIGYHREKLRTLVRYSKAFGPKCSSVIGALTSGRSIIL